jgi:hypothetical protein
VRPRRRDQPERHHLRPQLAQLRVHADATVDQPRRIGVERAVRREQRLARQPPAGVQRQRDGLAVVLGEVRQREQAREVEHLVEQEVDVAIVDERVRHARQNKITAP